MPFRIRTLQLILTVILKSRLVDNERYMHRIEAALSGPPVQNLKLESAGLEWLHKHGEFAVVPSIEDAMKVILFRMIVDQDFCKHLCQMLDDWARWAASGGMRLIDFCTINEDKVTFAQASLVIRTLSNFEDGPAAVLSKIQDCANRWEYVELG